MGSSPHERRGSPRLVMVYEMKRFPPECHNSTHTWCCKITRTSDTWNLVRCNRAKRREVRKGCKGSACGSVSYRISQSALLLEWLTQLDRFHISLNKMSCVLSTGHDTLEESNLDWNKRDGLEKNLEFSSMRLLYLWLSIALFMPKLACPWIFALISQKWTRSVCNACYVKNAACCEIESFLHSK